MDVEFWIYIIIGAIYFLSRLLKKPAQDVDKPAEPPRPERRPPIRSEQTAAEPPRQMTFEELLREITEGKQAQRQPEPPSQPQYESYETESYETESYETDPGEEARSLEQVGFDEAENARAYKAYEEAKQQGLQRQSLEETLHLADTVMDYGKFKAFQKQEKKNLSEDYIRILRSPQTLKQAVVMSEILKRKF